MAPLRGMVAGLVYVLGYVALDALSFVHPLLKLGITPWNPPAGLTLAFLLWFGWQRAGWTVVAALMAEFLVRGAPGAWWSLLLAASVPAAVYGGLAAILSRGKSRFRIEDHRSALALAIGAAVAALVAAAGYTAAFAAAGRLPGGAVEAGIARYWVGDLNGVLTLTPLLLSLKSGFRRQASRPRWWLFAGQGAFLILTLWVVVTATVDGELRFVYLLFAPVIWITLTWGVPGATTATLLIQAGLMLGGARLLATSSVVEAQYLLVTLGLTGLVLGSVLAEREAARIRLREQEESLARGMRFAMAGELASALTHELRQPLTALVSYLKSVEILADTGEVSGGRFRETVAKASAEALRATDVVRRLREFYGTGTSRVESCKSAVFFDELQQSVADRVHQSGVQWTADADAPELHADLAHLRLVLRNLIANALDALEGQPSGARQLHLRLRTVAGSQRIEVEDNGPGVAAEIAAELFNPFVTTKADGMGLGLAISRTLMRGQGGELRLESVAGGGCRFVVILPTGTDPEEASR